MSRLLLAFAALLGLFLPTGAGAYSWHTHQVIARIAMANVAPATRRAVMALVARSDLLRTPECRAGTLADMSSWADCIRRDAERFGHTAPWHYQNIDICKPFDLGGACANGDCVAAQVERQARLLRDRHQPLAVRVEALAFLVHLVGDLHQPLHAGDRGDAGGNGVKAAYGIYAPARLTLHTVWDNQLAERAFSTPPSIVRRYPAVERPAIAAGSVADWSRESWQIAYQAYRAAYGGDPCRAGGPPSRVHLSDAIVAELVAPQRRQILRAGLRLARLLDAALG